MKLQELNIKIHFSNESRIIKMEKLIEISSRALSKALQKFRYKSRVRISLKHQSRALSASENNIITTPTTTMYVETKKTAVAQLKVIALWVRLLLTDIWKQQFFF